MSKFMLYGVGALVLVVVLAGFYFVSFGEEEEVVSVIVPGVTETEIVIGSSSALGGHASFLGSQLLEGSEAYINYVNENGGVQGRQIKLIKYDDKYDPDTTLANTKKLIDEDEVFMLFDYVGTPTSKVILDAVNEAEIPLLGLFTGAEFLRNPFQPYIFNVRDSYYAEAEGAIEYFTSLGFTKIAIVYQNDAFGQAVLSGHKIALEERGLELVAEATYERGAMEVEGALATVKDSGAEAVVMVGTYSPLAKFIKISNDAGFNPYFHTVSFIGSKAFANELVNVQGVGASEYNKIIVTQVVPAPFTKDQDHKAVGEYHDLVMRENPDHEFNYVALEGFVNAKVLVEALDNAGRDITRKKVVFALESMKNNDIGVGKLVQYSDSDHQGLEGVYYSRLTDEGKFTVFNPIM